MYQQHVHHGVRPLRGFNRFLQPNLATLILRVRDNHQGLPSRFRRQLIAAGQIHRIVKMRPSRVRRNRSRGHHTTADCSNSRLVDRSFDLRAVIGKIRKQVHVQVETEYHRHVALAHHAF